MRVDWTDSYMPRLLHCLLSDYSLLGWQTITKERRAKWRIQLIPYSPRKEFSWSKLWVVILALGSPSLSRTHQSTQSPDSFQGPMSVACPGKCQLSWRKTRWGKSLEKDCEAKCFVLIIWIPVSVKTSGASTDPDIYKRPISVYRGKTCFEDQQRVWHVRLSSKACGRLAGRP